MRAARHPSSGRSAAGTRPRELVSLAARLIFAQAGMTTAIGLAYSRRNIPWLVTFMLAISLCLVALAVRSGTHGAWVTAVAFEGFFAVIGLYRFIYDRYLGGTLLGVAAFAFLMHPAVGRAFTALPGRGHEAPAFGDARYDELGESEPLGEQAG